MSSTHLPSFEKLVGGSCGIRRASRGSVDSFLESRRWSFRVGVPGSAPCVRSIWLPLRQQSGTELDASAAFSGETIVMPPPEIYGGDEVFQRPLTPRWSASSNPALRACGWLADW